MVIETREDNQIEFDQIDEEEISIEVPLLKRRIYSDQADPEIDSLYSRWKRGKLDLQPDFQRYYVWDVSKASRLIRNYQYIFKEICNG